MNESKQNFDELKRLLKLKQHEVPPPGYFNNFSGEVVARIRAGEAGSSQGDESSWLATMLRIFETKPGVIGAFATSLCLVLLIGVVLADRSDSVSADMLATVEPTPAATPELASVGPVSAVGADNSGIAVSTNPVISLQPVATLFSQQQNPLFQAASFTPGLR